VTVLWPSLALSVTLWSVRESLLCPAWLSGFPVAKNRGDHDRKNRLGIARRYSARRSWCTCRGPGAGSVVLKLGVRGRGLPRSGSARRRALTYTPRKRRLWGESAFRAVASFVPNGRRRPALIRTQAAPSVVPPAASPRIRAASATSSATMRSRRARRQPRTPLPPHQ
jgi:hypothetical protein